MVFFLSLPFLLVVIYSSLGLSGVLGPMKPKAQSIDDNSNVDQQQQQQKPPQDPSRYLFITYVQPFRTLKPKSQRKNSDTSFSGDSWTTTKFDAAGTQPSTANRLGNSAGTFSGGANWVGVLANDYMPSETFVYNYAVGGNLVNLAYTPSKSDFIKARVKDLIQQTDEFEGLGHSVPWNGQNALAINWFGINDVQFIGIDNEQMRSPYSIYGVLTQDNKDYFDQLERQYQLGIRNFIVPLAPPLAKTPSYFIYRADKIPAINNYLAFWNDAIKKGVQDFQGRHQDAKLAIFDSEPIFTNVMNNFAQFGAPDQYCVSNPMGQPCLWWDPIHPGIELNKELGKAMYEVVKSMQFV